MSIHEAGQHHLATDVDHEARGRFEGRLQQPGNLFPCHRDGSRHETASGEHVTSADEDVKHLTLRGGPKAARRPPRAPRR